MTELDYIIDLHKDSERQGPGSESETLKALDLITLPADELLKIADIGCGTGASTITLAQNTHSHITAVDIFSDFLHELDIRAEKLGLSSKISTLEKSMDQLPFGDEEFDIIWSEGGIYNIGFEHGLRLWKPFLKKDGYLAVSEITWIDLKRPKEIQDFWDREYPGIDTAGAKINLLEKHGFVLEGYFKLAEESWIKNYYQPLEKKLESFLNRHHKSDMAVNVAEETRAEIDLYHTYKKYYSYGFYVAKKVE